MIGINIICDISYLLIVIPIFEGHNSTIFHRIVPTSHQQMQICTSKCEAFQVVSAVPPQVVCVG